MENGLFYAFNIKCILAFYRVPQELLVHLVLQESLVIR